MAGRGPCLDCWHCPKKAGGGAVAAAVIAVLVLARAHAVVRLVEMAAKIVVITVASVAALIVAAVAVKVVVRVRARRRQRRLLALPAAVHNAATVRADIRAITAASLAIEAPAHAVIPGELLGVSATDPLPRAQQTASRQGTRAASQ